jgi:hypothetical protein
MQAQQEDPLLPPPTTSGHHHYNHHTDEDDVAAHPLHLYWPPTCYPDEYDDADIPPSSSGQEAHPPAPPAAMAHLPAQHFVGCKPVCWLDAASSLHHLLVGMELVELLSQQSEGVVLFRGRLHHHHHHHHRHPTQAPQTLKPRRCFVKLRRCLDTFRSEMQAMRALRRAPHLRARHLLPAPHAFFHVRMLDGTTWGGICMDYIDHTVYRLLYPGTNPDTQRHVQQVERQFKAEALRQRKRGLPPPPPPLPQQHTEKKEEDNDDNDNGEEEGAAGVALIPPQGLAPHVDLATAIVAACMEALQRMHSAGWAHGDTHLGNFMIDLRKWRIYLIDLELSFQSTDPRQHLLDIQELWGHATGLLTTAVKGKEQWDMVDILGVATLLHPCCYSGSGSHGEEEEEEEAAPPAFKLTERRRLAGTKRCRRSLEAEMDDDDDGGVGLLLCLLPLCTCFVPTGGPPLADRKAGCALCVSPTARRAAQAYQTAPPARCVDVLRHGGPTTSLPALSGRIQRVRSSVRAQVAHLHEAVRCAASACSSGDEGMRLLQLLFSATEKTDTPEPTARALVERIHCLLYSSPILPHMRDHAPSVMESLRLEPRWGVRLAEEVRLALAAQRALRQCALMRCS